MGYHTSPDLPRSEKFTRIQCRTEHWGRLHRINISISLNMSLVYADTKGANATWSQRSSSKYLELHHYFTESRVL